MRESKYTEGQIARTPRRGMLVPASLLLLLSAGCSRPEPGLRLVVLYATCTVSAHYLSPYDPSLPFTPNLEGFARESTVFLRHNTESGQSGTDYASIFTGAQADRHGVYYHPRRLDDELYLIAEAFADNGYETYFRNGHAMASPSLNYGQGVAPENTTEGGPEEVFTVTDDGFRELLAGLAADRQRRAFVQVNFSLTHSPYDVKAGPAVRRRLCAAFPARCEGVTETEIQRWVSFYREHFHPLQWNFDETMERVGMPAADLERLAAVLELLHFASIHELDRRFGMLLDSIRTAGLGDESMVVFTADHGEVLYRDNALFKWTHGSQLAPEVIDVPLILRDPRLAGSRYEGVTRSIDVFPTVAGLAGLDLPTSTQIQGRDLSPVLRGERSAPELTAFSHTTVHVPEMLEQAKAWTLSHRLIPRSDPELMWVRARRGDRVYKWRRFLDGSWRMQVFDLARDPGERVDLRDPADGEQEEALRRLLRYKEQLVRAYDQGAIPRREDDAEQRLRSLGYIQ